MKRFFQPVPKDGSPAKKRLAAAADSGDGSGAADCAGGKGELDEEPRKFLTWNANSLLLRMKNDWPAFSQFVTRLDPDVICVQVSDHGVRFRALPWIFSPRCNPNQCPEVDAAMWHAKY
jgi:hypothetical protein